ncbi:hypothetical protein QJS10_CPB13g01342 [Acorus calamus]|uniref:Uncharacterized protein n=1 Tax=Acorus calamus TaxID=4465 RepID=A0AAV9DJJ0_ACOCL|nr:hypothetical protein QJS10_CPB13g01342 [Acorus calamus]
MKEAGVECVHDVGVDVLDGGEAVHGNRPCALEEEVEEMEGIGFGGGHGERWVGGDGGLSLVGVGVLVVVGGGGGGGGCHVVLGVNGGRGDDKRISVGEEEEQKSMVVLLSGRRTAGDPTDGFVQQPLSTTNFLFDKPYDKALSERYSFINGVHRFWVYDDDKPFKQAHFYYTKCMYLQNEGIWFKGEK